MEVTPGGRGPGSELAKDMLVVASREGQSTSLIRCIGEGSGWGRIPFKLELSGIEGSHYAVQRPEGLSLAGVIYIQVFGCWQRYKKTLALGSGNTSLCP